jgi:lactoylglutathione lyase
MYDDTQPALKIAVAGTPGGRIDKHFGQAEDFLVYVQGPDGPHLLESRSVTAHAQGDEDRRDTICRMLADCRVLLVAKIGPVPQEKLAGVGIEATDMHAGKDILPTLTEMFAAKAQAAQTHGNVDSSSFRLMHAMLRVSDMERALDFYTRLLGMTVLEMREHKKNQFTQAYLGYGAGWDGMALELVFNWTNEEPYVPGNSFGHIAIQVTGITALCDRLAAEGVPLPRPPRSQRHGENIVAFVEDPDGHRIELVQMAK